MLFYALEIIDCYDGHCSLPMDIPPNDLFWKRAVVIASYDNKYDYKVFLENEFATFSEVVKEAKEIIGFANVCCADKILKTSRIGVTTNFDLHDQINRSLGERQSVSMSQELRKRKLSILVENNLPFFTTRLEGQANDCWYDNQISKVKQSCLLQLNHIIQLFQRSNKLYDATSGNFIRLPLTNLELEENVDIPF